MSRTIIQHASEHSSTVEVMYKESTSLAEIAPAGLGIFNTNFVVGGAIMADFDDMACAHVGCSFDTSTPIPSLINEEEFPAQEFFTICVPDLDISDTPFTRYTCPPPPAPAPRYGFVLNSLQTIFRFLSSWVSFGRQPPTILRTPIIGTFTRRDATKTSSMHMLVFLGRLFSVIKKPQSKTPPPRLKALILAQQYATTSISEIANQQNLLQRLLALLKKLWIKSA